MNQSELIAKIRANVQKGRDQWLDDLITRRIKWSIKTSKRNWLSKLIFGGPKTKLTRQEAFALLCKEAVNDRFHGLHYCYKLGQDVIKLCDAIETAKKSGLPLKLTTEEVNLINQWSN